MRQKRCVDGVKGEIGTLFLLLQDKEEALQSTERDRGFLKTRGGLEEWGGEVRTTVVFILISLFLFFSFWKLY